MYCARLTLTLAPTLDCAREREGLVQKLYTVGTQQNDPDQIQLGSSHLRSWNEAETKLRE